MRSFSFLKGLGLFALLLSGTNVLADIYYPVYPVIPVYPIEVVPSSPIDDYVPLYVKSNCVHDLQVLIWTWDPITRDYTNAGGWHRVRPGDTELIASTEYNYAYIFVQTDQFYDPATQTYRRETWDGDYSMWYNHERYRAQPFGDGDIPGHSSYKMTYTCY